jgi:predicted  nucleic acid-binding Zn-ribbon protein
VSKCHRISKIPANLNQLLTPVYKKNSSAIEVYYQLISQKDIRMTKRATSKWLSTYFIFIFSLSAYANLPDEVNYGPYHSSYISLRNDRDYTSESLENSRSQLESVLNSITEKENYINLLNSQISDYQNEISDLNYELPGRQANLRQTQSDLRGVNSVLNDLYNREQKISRNIDGHRQSLRPFQNDLKDKQLKLRNVQTKFKNTVNSIKQKRALVASEKSKIENNKVAIQRINEIIKRLQDSKGTLQSKIQSLKVEIEKLTNNIASLQQKINEMTANHKMAKMKLQKEQDKLKQLMAANADPEKIKAQRQIVQTKRAQVQKIAERIRAAKPQLESKRVAKKNKSVEHNKVKGDLAEIPTKITAQKRKSDQLTAQNQSLRSSIQTTQTQVASLVSEKERLITRKSDLERKVTNISSKISAIKVKIDELTSRLQNVRRKISNNETSRSNLERGESSLISRINQIIDRLPQLDRSISYNTSEVSSAQSAIRLLTQDENQTRNQIASLENELSQLQNQTDAAYAQYEQRYQLYNQYEAEAQSIGQSQTGIASSIGQTGGEDLADVLSESISTTVANDYGKVEAALIGSVRGEIKGYHDGYNVGYVDSTSIDEATTQATADGVDAAIDYAQNNYAPAFFEEFMLAKISNSSSKGVKSLVEMGSINLDSLNKVNKFIENLSNAEIDESRNLKTSLDSKIEDLLTDEQRVESLLAKMTKPAVAYVAPTNIPYQTIDCGSVYKGLQHFKSICEDSYKANFKNIYLSNVYDTFVSLYSNLFTSKFDLKESSVRAANYQASLTASESMAFAEAKVVGKQDIYDNTYSSVYTEAYNTELPKAQTRSKAQAKVDVDSWIQSNAIITVNSSAFNSQNLKGGDSGIVYLNLKNISSNASFSAALVDIKKSENINFGQAQYVFTKINGMEIKRFEIPFSVKATAASGQNITLAADVNLPGDKYKSARIESIQISQPLMLNPKETSENRFDATPKVKGVFRYNVHSFQVNIAPAVENLKDGYEVSFIPKGENAQTVRMKNTVVKTKALRKGEVQKVSLSYVFYKSAKNRDVKFDLVIKYKGLVLKSEEITLRPR